MLIQPAITGASVRHYWATKRRSSGYLRGHVPRAFGHRFSAHPALWWTYRSRVLIPINGFDMRLVAKFRTERHPCQTHATRRSPPGHGRTPRAAVARPPETIAHPRHLSL